MPDVWRQWDQVAMKLSKAAQRIERATSELAEVAGQLGYLSYKAGESDVLKEAAIAAGIDHTREPTWVVERLGEMAVAQRETVALMESMRVAFKRDLGELIAEHPEALAREPRLRDALDAVARTGSYTRRVVSGL